MLADPDAAARLIRVLGASSGLGDFFQRHPGELGALLEPLAEPPTGDEYVADLLGAVESLGGEAGWVALRVRYRRHLARLTAWDLEQADPRIAVERVAAALADLAGAALDAALDVARRDVRFPAAQLADDEARDHRHGQGRGARAQLRLRRRRDLRRRRRPAGSTDDRAVEIATRLAIQTMRGIHDLAAEPGLWEVDANLRPEGKDGALVRTARVAPGVLRPLGEELGVPGAAQGAPARRRSRAGRTLRRRRSRRRCGRARRGRTSSSRCSGCASASPSSIPPSEVDVQLKLGPGGPARRRVHGAAAATRARPGRPARAPARRPSPALIALADRGYVGRVEAAEFAQDYRFLRLLEHRLQLTRLRRTHLMPTDPDGAAGARTGERRRGAPPTELHAQWQRTKQAVRSLHERLFYRPLLSAVAALPEDGFALTSDQAEARLAAIGFRDPRAALNHIAALTGGVSRRATIQRNLLPVMLAVVRRGSRPRLRPARVPAPQRGPRRDLLVPADAARLLGRRPSPDAACSPVRGSSARSSSASPRRRPGSRTRTSCARARSPCCSTRPPRPSARHRDDEAAAALALRTARRREMLRTGARRHPRRHDDRRARAGAHRHHDRDPHGDARVSSTGYGDGIEFGIIAMGRYGGAELGFGSDADVMYVYRPAGASDEDGAAQRRAASCARSARSPRTCAFRSTSTSACGRRARTGRSCARSSSYRAYYARWSLTWEAQALLRARPVAGERSRARRLRERSPTACGTRIAISRQDVREIKRIKARVEAERLPQAADPSRHLKLGRGSLSDVEWFVQLLQLQHGARGGRAAHDIDAQGARRRAARPASWPRRTPRRLRSAWIFASRVPLGDDVVDVRAPPTCCRPTGSSSRGSHGSWSTRPAPRRDSRRTTCGSRAGPAGVRAAVLRPGAKVQADARLDARGGHRCDLFFVEYSLRQLHSGALFVVPRSRTVAQISRSRCCRRSGGPDALARALTTGSRTPRLGVLTSVFPAIVGTGRAAFETAEPGLAGRRCRRISLRSVLSGTPLASAEFTPLGPRGRLR